MKAEPMKWMKLANSLLAALRQADAFKNPFAKIIEDSKISKEEKEG